MSVSGFPPRPGLPWPLKKKKTKTYFLSCATTLLSEGTHCGEGVLVDAWLRGGSRGDD